MTHDEIKAEATRRGFDDLIPSWNCEEENECFVDCSDLYEEKMRILKNGLDNLHLHP